jgi:hypothetical protein
MKDAAKPVHFLLYFFFISGCPHHSYGSMLSLCLFNKVVLVTLYFTPCTAATATRTGGQTPVRSGLDWKFVACCFLFASNKLVFVTVSITLSIVYTSASWPIPVAYISLFYSRFLWRSTLTHYHQNYCSWAGLLGSTSNAPAETIVATASYSPSASTTAWSTAARASYISTTAWSTAARASYISTKASRWHLRRRLLWSIRCREPWPEAHVFCF